MSHRLEAGRNVAPLPRTTAKVVSTISQRGGYTRRDILRILKALGAGVVIFTGATALIRSSHREIHKQAYGPTQSPPMSSSTSSTPGSSPGGEVSPVSSPLSITPQEEGDITSALRRSESRIQQRLTGTIKGLEGVAIDRIQLSEDRSSLSGRLHIHWRTGFELFRVNTPFSFSINRRGEVTAFAVDETTMAEPYTSEDRRARVPPNRTLPDEMARRIKGAFEAAFLGEFHSTQLTKTP